MYTILLLAAVGFFVGVALYLRWLARYNQAVAQDKHGYAPRSSGFFPTTLVSAGVGTFVGFVVAILGSNLFPPQPVELGRWDLAAMRTVDSTGGVFVWGTGNVGSETVYRVMILNRDGSLSPFQAEVTNNNTTIVEEDSLKDRGLLIIRVWGYDKSAPSYNWFMHPKEGTGSAYEYHVPKGTVRNTFDAR